MTVTVLSKRYSISILGVATAAAQLHPSLDMNSRSIVMQLARYVRSESSVGRRREVTTFEADKNIPFSKLAQPLAMQDLIPATVNVLLSFLVELCKPNLSELRHEVFGDKLPIICKEVVNLNGKLFRVIVSQNQSETSDDGHLLCLKLVHVDRDYDIVQEVRDADVLISKACRLMAVQMME